MKNSLLPREARISEYVPRLNKDEFIFMETIAKICDMKFIIEKSYWEIKTMRLKQELVNIAKELLDKQSLLLMI